MRLEGLHHITMITGDAQGNVAFYAEVLGLRLVKKTVNFDQPDAYHLYFGDEHGSPGSILTWFEFAGAAPGRPGAGMIHRIDLGVAGEAALDFWAQRLPGSRREDPATLSFTDPDGLGLRLVVAGDGNPPLRADHPDVPSDFAITGVEGVRAFAPDDPARPESLLTDVLGFDPDPAHPGDHRLQGERRHVHWGYDAAPSEPGIQGSGTVHHIAWASTDADHLGWQARVREAGYGVTDVRDRDYFDAIYFREPRGILFEIATLGPGFATDETPEHLGEALRVPKMHAHLREQLEQILAPVENPRVARARR